ncbi:MAG: beta-N-acetylhexosaminidase [Nitrosospira sp.]|nr:beta-N-acetylhexosaminidase [Nitrosospira sp.]
MSIGPLMLDIESTQLTADERKKLQHPLVGGVILFSRNYTSLQQLTELTADIHALKTPPLLITVDHEGGRVQRFREGFTRIPAMREFGRVWDNDRSQAKYLAKKTGYVLAAELRACGVDFSFTPVLDVDHGRSHIINDRAFHSKPEAIADLAFSLVSGLKIGGMAAVGKHFPGHGYTSSDSHKDWSIDKRTYTDIENNDLIPFQRMIHSGIAGIMPAHVVYPKIDSFPASLSKKWLKEVLRDRLNFNGCIFSDDLSMKGAAVVGDIVQRAESALSAGCDMVLVCNDSQGADDVLKNLEWNVSAISLLRLSRMRGRPYPDSMVELNENVNFIKAMKEITGIGFGNGELPFI